MTNLKLLAEAGNVYKCVCFSRWMVRPSVWTLCRTWNSVWGSGVYLCVICRDGVFLSLQASRHCPWRSNYCHTRTQLSLHRIRSDTRGFFQLYLPGFFLELLPAKLYHNTLSVCLLQMYTCSVMQKVRSLQKKSVHGGEIKTTAKTKINTK